MLRLTEQQINEIAVNLDYDMKYYYNKRTREIETIIDFDIWMGAVEEPWAEDLKEIEENWEDYYEFESSSNQQIY